MSGGASVAAKIAHLLYFGNPEIFAVPPRKLPQRTLCTQGTTPLHWAVHNNPECVTLLVSFNATNGYGETAPGEPVTRTVCEAPRGGLGGY